MEINNIKTYSEVKELILSGNLSCKKLVSIFLERIHQQRHLNAFLEVYEQEAIERAIHIDNKIANQQAGKLAGMVIAIKDNICYKDHRVSAASKILEGFVSVYSSTVVERLLTEDAIIIGRLNCDEFAMGSSSENSAYEKVLNPIDNDRVPGGSSGGSAAAVAAGCCMVALGSDTGGSIRQPASYCGVVGLKPSYGRVSRHGLIAFASSFDQIGPIGNCIEDIAAVLEVIAGADDFDSTAAMEDVSNYTTDLKNNIATKQKIAYFDNILNHEGLDKEVKEQFQATIEQLKSWGHEVEAVSFPYFDYLIPTYYVLTTAEASSNLSRYDGMRYGYRSPNAVDLETTYVKSRSEGFGQEVKRRIMLGTFVLSSGYYDAYYSKAQKVRRLIVEATKAIFKQYDFIIMPTTPDVAFEFNKKTTNPVEMYLEDIFTVYANLAGLPAISLPLHYNAERLPFGFQIIADKFEELKLLKFSNYLLQNQKEKQPAKF